MNRIALRMLMGDRGKYLGLIFGVTFATHLMSQQVSIFMGIVSRTGNAILDVRDADIWVMDERVRFVDEAPPMPDSDLMRVRGVPGVSWAVPLYKGAARARLEDGEVRNLMLTGLDDASLVGAPSHLIAGRLDDLRRPDAVILDTAGYEWMWGKEPYRLGRTFQINDRRAVLVGVCSVGSPFFSVPQVYTRYSNALRFAPPERNAMTYVLASPRPGEDPRLVAERITEQTGRLALTRSAFFWKTIRYFLSSTGIPVNFGVTIALGFLVGAAVTGQTLYLFTIENLRQFGALKAMGVRNGRILRMILLQATVVGGLGYGLGVGMTAIFFITTGQVTHLAGLAMTPVAFLGTGLAVFVIILLTSFISARKVLALEPAVVFRG
ncbi:ABC transporter permease [Tautonia rosea]|uniref:ABC transporter permease n=1 Tax=Tautonia rosea TaxID=2728037 RepID=UPI001472C0EC|nr:ABC transporter permease [Tautonia rosea]